MFISGKKLKIHLLYLLIILITLSAASLMASKYALSVTHITASTGKISSSLRIVQLTDLHDSSFGRGNSRLIRKVKEQAPDVILITGDLVNAKQENTEIAVNLIKNLVKIAPVYCSDGNHEVEYQENYGTDLHELYREAGAQILDREYQDVEIAGQQLRIGGIYGYCLPAKYESEARADETEFLIRFQDTDRLKILMCHMPVCWVINESLDEWNVDYVFAGHVHGGEVILPFAGGIYAPDMGWFPGRLEGEFKSKDQERTLILSRGLGTTEMIPRFNNIPEIMVVDIDGEK